VISQFFTLTASFTIVTAHRSRNKVVSCKKLTNYSCLFFLHLIVISPFLIHFPGLQWSRSVIAMLRQTNPEKRASYIMYNWLVLRNVATVSLW